MKAGITLSTTTLTQFDRGAIALLLQQGQTQQQIADTIGVAKSTICTELQRVKPYDPLKAQQDAKLKRQQEKRGQYQTGTSIENRPAVVNQRQEFGHWEVDTVLSSRGQTKACLVTLCGTPKSDSLGAQGTRSNLAVLEPGFCEFYAALSRNS